MQSLLEVVEVIVVESECLLQEFTVPAIPMTSAQIVADIAERIATGQYPPGSKLPSYAELGEMYSASTATIYRVIAILRDRGVVVGQSGRGTFVAEKPGH